jgi:sugar lactone lactonase YvrE
MSVTSNRTGFSLRIAKAVLFLMVASTAILSGCAQQKGCSTKPTFFPPPPDEPRIQWLTGISTSEDIGAKESENKFSFFITGQEKPTVIHRLGKSYGLAVRNGKIYVAESAEGRVAIIDPVNSTFEYLKGLEDPRGVLKEPVNMAFDTEGYLYVADTARKQIVVYGPDGSYSNAFGGNLGKGSKIVSVAVYQDKLYALDMGISRIRVLDRKTGEQTAMFGYIEKPNQSLRAPSNFTIDAAGSIYVTNIGNNKVMKYDLDGNFLGAFGGIGDQISTFVKPKGIAVDEAGRIYVVDAGTNVVQMFDDQFRPLTFFGWPGLETGSLNMPAGIMVTKENLQYFQKYAVPGFQLESVIFVVNQFGRQFCIPRISVYGLGRMQDKKSDVPAPQEEKPVKTAACRPGMDD